MGVARVGQSCVQEAEMGVMVLPCPVHGMPDGHHVGVQMGVRLALRGDIPQAGIALRERTYTASDDLLLVEGDENTDAGAFVKFQKQLFRRW